MKNEIKQKTAYLIGDSETAGKDQIISNTLYFKIVNFGTQRKYAELDNDRNEKTLEIAQNMAKKDNFTNIRLVIVTKKAITNKLGIFRWVEKKRIQKPFKF